MADFNELDVLSPAVTGQLHTQPSAFDDFWGVITGFEARVGEDEADKRFYRQMVMHIQMDNPIGDVSEMWESYNLPTDPKTGDPLKNEDGSIARPSATSKWGVQEVQLSTSLGVPWEGRAQNLIGLHARFVRKGTRLTRDDIAANKRAPKGEPPYGRYIVEWDYYNNDVRKKNGLDPIGTTFKDVAEGGKSATVADVTGDDLKVAVAKLAVGRTFIDLFRYISENHPELAAGAKRESVVTLVTEGYLTTVEDAEGKTLYNAGPLLKG